MGIMNSDMQYTIPCIKVELGDYVTINPELLPATEYVGEYIITPSNVPQVLETEERYLRQNIEISPVSYSEVENSAGGITVIIGG